MRCCALVLSVLAAAAPGAAAQDASPGATPEFAIVEVALLDAAGEEVGTAELTELTDGGVGFVVAVAGLEPGDHGIHVHETGVCEPGGTRRSPPPGATSTRAAPRTAARRRPGARRTPATWATSWSRPTAPPSGRSAPTG